MTVFGELYGNDTMKMTLGADILNGKPSHAYVLEGPAGSGKHTAARLIAMALLCEKLDPSRFPCGKCPSCRKISQDICTDVIKVSRPPDRATIGINTIRDMKETVPLAPVETERKIYVIEEADKMTPQAQNSLLLVLEEPPEFVNFILLCSDASLLLETVRSRAPVIKMEQFSADEIKKYLTSSEKYEKYTSDKAKLDDAVASAGGSIGRAAMILTGKDSAKLKEAKLCREITPLLLSKDAAVRLSAVKKFPAKRDELVSLLKTLTVALRDILAVKKTGGATLFFTDRKEAEALAAQVTASRLETLFCEVSSAISRISANCSAAPILLLLATKN